jgi:hypothetical protein
VARHSIQIDWLSVVLPVPPLGEGSELTHNSALIESAIRNEIGEDLANRIFSHLHVLDYGRAPYSHGWKDDARGVTIWAGGAVPHFTIELSGKGVAYLREIEGETAFLEGFAPFLSRIDIAIDLEQGVSPQEFLKYRQGGKQLTNANMSSPSGNTCYVGSMHSERYMRVYKYSAPHPRSHLLRLEMVARRAYAKQAGKAILSDGLVSVAKASLETFGFGHTVDFGQDVPASDLTVFRPERNMGKTLRWLMTCAAPAFQRLVREGTIPDARKFLESYFLSALDEQDALE